MFDVTDELLVSKVNTPPLAATKVAVGKSSTLNPVPFAFTNISLNLGRPSTVTTLAENPVPFNLLDTEIVSLLVINTLASTPVNVIFFIPVLAGYTSSSVAFWYEVRVAPVPLLAELT